MTEDQLEATSYTHLIKLHNVKPWRQRIKYKFTPRRTNKLTPDTVKAWKRAAGVRLNVKESCALRGVTPIHTTGWMKK